MTYFEWVNELRKIKSSPMDYDLLQGLNNKSLNGGEYIYNRFISHVINTLVDRLDKAYENLFNAIVSGIDLDNLSLELIRYKKELKFIYTIVDLHVIKKEDKSVIITNMDKTIGDIYNILRSNIESIDVDGYYISTFEKIMNSDVEE